MSAEVLLTCPRCHKHGFTPRGLRAHHCRANKRRRLSVAAVQNAERQARELAAAAVSTSAPQPSIPSPQVSPASSSFPSPSPIPMSQPSKHALTVYAAPQFRLKEDEAQKLEAVVVEQLETIALGERRNAALAILVGFNLQRLRVSTKHGQWTARLKQILTHVKICSPGTAVVYASLWMRLADKCADAKRLSLPDLLTLPGSQAEMALDVVEDSKSRRLLTAISEFVGQKSLNELLIHHQLKGVTREGDTGPDAKPAAGEDYFAEVAQTLTGWRDLVTSREKLMRLSPTQLDTLHETVQVSYGEFRKLYAEARGTRSAAAAIEV